MNEFYTRNIVEAALLAAGKPLTLAELGQLFDESTRPKADDVRVALDGLAAEYSNRALEVKETAAGFRIQVRREFAGEISRLWPERPPKYSRALLETLALIAYRQPITRAEIEAVRGVAVNPNIVKTVIERNWVRVVGHRDVPGRPELLGTTREFLDYFGLRSLDELPPLAELKAMGDYNLQLDLPNGAALEGPKGEGEVEGVAGLLTGDAAVAEGTGEVAEAVSTEAGSPESVTSDATADAVSDANGAHDATAAAGEHEATSSDAVAHDAVSDAATAHDAVAAATQDPDVGAHDAVAAATHNPDAVGAHDAGAAATQDPDAVDAHDPVAADTHHEAVAFGAHDEVATDAHDAVAKADIDEDAEADRTLSSAVEADSSESQDALDDSSDDDADDDELSADGHESRELVAAPRDSDT